jgi:two-component SAPR family response regulator
MVATTARAHAEEDVAIQVDAERRVRELRRVIERLWPDRDDSAVMSELTSLFGQLRQAEGELKAGGEG